MKSYYIERLDGEPLLNNSPQGAIPQVKIQYQWILTSVVERHRIERVIRLLCLEMSPATRAAQFKILVGRQTERTGVLLKYLAEYPEPMLKDVEMKLISWDKYTRVSWSICVHTGRIHVNNWSRGI